MKKHALTAFIYNREFAVDDYESDKKELKRDIRRIICVGTPSLKSVPMLPKNGANSNLGGFKVVYL